MINGLPRGRVFVDRGLALRRTEGSCLIVLPCPSEPSAAEASSQATVPSRRHVSALTIAGMMACGLLLSGCGGGVAEHGTSLPVAAAPTDLDTARPPPQTVTQAPLLPPVPSNDPTQTLPPAMRNLEHLYSEDEQARIQADLAAAAARAQR